MLTNGGIYPYVCMNMYDLLICNDCVNYDNRRSFLNKSLCGRVHGLSAQIPDITVNGR